MSIINDPKKNRPIFAIDKDFGEAAVRAADPLWDLPELSLKQKAFLCMASDICRAHLGLPFIMHMKMALDVGATRSELKAVILHAAPYASYPTALGAMWRFKVFTVWRKIKATWAKEDNVATETVPDLMKLLPENYNKELAKLFKKTMLPVWQRPGLSFEDKVLITLVSDVANQVLGTPFEFHLNMAKAAKISEAKIRQTMTFTSEYSFAKTCQAMRAVDEYFGSVSDKI